MRAQMEQERVARQKRLRREAGLDDDDIEQPPAKRQHVSSPSASRTNSYSSSASTSRVVQSTSTIPTIDRIFWDGEMRQTANMHAEPRRDGKPTFRLTDVLGKVRLSVPYRQRYLDIWACHRKQISLLQFCHLTHWISRGYTNFSIDLCL
jgi:hypothetical protein